MAERFDAIIIGAGVIGTCVGLGLARKGWRTLNVDRNPAVGYGSTSASSAIIRSHYSTIEGTAMAYEAWHHWCDWAGHLGVDDERGLAKYRNVGCVVVKTEANKYMQPICANLDALGIPWEDWTADELKAHLPIVDVRRFAPPKRPDDPGFGDATGDAVAGAVYFPRAGYVTDPQLAAHNAQRAAEAAGAEFRFNAEVTAVRKVNGRVAGITLADGTDVDAPVVVNVGGPFSTKLNAMAGVLDGMAIRTRPLRQEVAHVPAPAGFDFEANGHVLSDDDVGCYCRPEIGNHLLIGSHEPECDPLDWADPDDFNQAFSEQWRAQVWRQAQRMPGLPVTSPVRGVVALYDVSDDWIPIYDKSDLPGFYMAIGTSGNQFKNAPVAGRVMAELITACEAGQDHDADPVQVTYDYTGWQANIGFFSRNREVNPESSFTVMG